LRPEDPFSYADLCRVNASPSDKRRWPACYVLPVGEVHLMPETAEEYGTVADQDASEIWAAKIEA